MKFADTPSAYYATGQGLVNRNVLFDSDNNAVTLFSYTGTWNSQLLMQLIRNDLEITYRRILFKLRGTIIDTTKTVDVLGLGFNSIVKDYNSRYYFPTGSSYDLKHVTFTGEWLQFWDESGTGEFNDDFSDDFFT